MKTEETTKIDEEEEIDLKSGCFYHEKQLP